MIRIGPGTYTLMGPPRTKDEKLVVKDEPELMRDFRMPRPERGPFAGRVVRADDLSKGVTGARVEVVVGEEAAEQLRRESGWGRRIGADGGSRKSFPAPKRPSTPTP